MTMVDEEMLQIELRRAAEGFVVSQEAAERILIQAEQLDARPAGVRRLRRGRHPHAEVWPTSDDATPDGDVAEPRRSWSRRSRGVRVAVAAAGLAGITLIALVTVGGTPSGKSVVSAGPSNSSATGSGASARYGVDHGALRVPAPQSPSAKPTAPTLIPTLPSGAVGQSSKVEETGSVNLTIGKGRLERVLTSLTELAVANGGFAASTVTQSGGPSDSPSYGSITLQVPEANFSSILTQAQLLGTVTSLSSKGTDVTGQYVDLQSRIAALQASRDQYLTIMSKATSISDILAVQNQLDSLQSRLEQLQGQLQVLDSQTTFATLAVDLTETGARRPPLPPPASGIGDAWHGAVSGFAAAFDGVVRIAGPTLFVLLCIAALVVFGRVAWRGMQRRIL